MLGGLQWDGHARPGAELAGPHAGRVDHVLALDGASVGEDAVHGALLREHVQDRDPLGDRHPLLPSSPSQGHGDVDGIDAAVAGDVEAGEDVVGARQGEHLGDLGRRQLVHVDTAVAVEGGDPLVLLEAVGVGGQLDEPNRLEASRQARLLLQLGVQVTRVEAQLRRGVRHGAERDHQPGGVPRRARRQLIALDEHDVTPAGMRRGGTRSTSR